MMRAPDPPAQLVQLRQAEAIRPRHDDGVGSGHVDASFDNRGAQQHVEALLVKIAHHRLQFALAHLAVGDADARLRQQFLQLFQGVMNGLHLVVQVIHLPAALQFAQHGLADDAVAVLRHEGFDRQTPLRRGGNHREITQPFQRHGQGARNRRGGQGQDVHGGAQRFQALLLLHPEAVLLIHNHQAQIVKLHILLQQLMRADDDVQLALGQIAQGLRLLLAGAEARQLAHPHREFGKATGKILEMLLGQQRGRHQQRHLLAVHGGDKGGAQGHFGLAKTHIAAHQPIHRFAGLQIAQHRFDGGQLIRRFLKTKTVGKRLIIVRRQLAHLALAQGALGIQVQQLGGGVAGLLHGAALALVPRAIAQPVQRCTIRCAAAVATDQMQLRHRHIQLVAPGIFQQQKFRFTLAQIQRD